MYVSICGPWLVRESVTGPWVCGMVVFDSVVIIGVYQILGIVTRCLNGIDWNYTKMIPTFSWTNPEQTIQ